MFSSLRVLFVSPVATMILIVLLAHFATRPMGTIPSVIGEAPGLPGVSVVSIENVYPGIASKVNALRHA